VSPRRPDARPRPRLDRDQLVAAAVDLLDEEGLDRLTTRALATRLGVQSPALYWYVRDKGELLDLVADAICAPALAATAAIPANLGWREQATAALRVYRAVLRSHRDVPRLLAERPPVGPARRRLADGAIGLVLEAGFDEADAAVISLLLGDYVISIVSEELRIEAARETYIQVDAAPDDADQYPNMARIGPHFAVMPTDVLFETGLEILLDGIEQRLQRRHGQRGATPARVDRNRI
jgi:TetR/AcrR family tetracycline transcriptional repressor